MKITSMLLLMVGLWSFSSFGKEPDCTGSERWPASMAFTHLKNDGVLDNGKIDFTKTKVTKLSSHKVKKDVYRQVHLVVFQEKSGATIQAITVNDATSDECSGGPVDVYLISKRIGGK